jgi:hypothetical protein
MEAAALLSSDETRGHSGPRQGVDSLGRPGRSSGVTVQTEVEPTGTSQEPGQDGTGTARLKHSPTSGQPVQMSVFQAQATPSSVLSLKIGQFKPGKLAGTLRTEEHRKQGTRSCLYSVCLRAQGHCSQCPRHRFVREWYMPSRWHGYAFICVLAVIIKALMATHQQLGVV